jgi:hypothetical protein
MELPWMTSRRSVVLRAPKAIPGIGMKSSAARASFLAALSLSRDPFAWASAEQELQASIYGAEPERLQSELIPIFFEYFTPPPIPIPEGRTLLGVLHDPGPACIYGERGSGKTMLRLALEAYIRLFPENTLVISHPLREDDPQTPGPRPGHRPVHSAYGTGTLVRILKPGDESASPPRPAAGCSCHRPGDRPLPSGSVAGASNGRCAAMAGSGATRCAPSSPFP